MTAHRSTRLDRALPFATRNASTGRGYARSAADCTAAKQLRKASAAVRAEQTKAETVYVCGDEAMGFGRCE